VAVTVVHRHRAIRECAFNASSGVCTGPELDADTATTVRFEPVGVAKAAPKPSRRFIELSFSRQLGIQERTINLTVGDWLIDWSGAATIARLRVTTAARPSVTLVTSTGRCRVRDGRCQLEEHRVRRIVIRDNN
jgi:hypothetical protein